MILVIMSSTDNFKNRGTIKGVWKNAPRKKAPWKIAPKKMAPRKIAPGIMPPKTCFTCFLMLLTLHYSFSFLSFL